MRHLKDACRSLAATPIVSVVAILSLALGVGANTAIFSIVNTLLLRSLPVHTPEELAILRHGDGRPRSRIRSGSRFASTRIS